MIYAYTYAILKGRGQRRRKLASLEQTWRNNMGRLGRIGSSDCLLCPRCPPTGYRLHYTSRGLKIGTWIEESYSDDGGSIIIIIIRGKWCPAFSFYVYHVLHCLSFIPNLVPLLLVPLHGVESGMIHLVSQWWKITGKLLRSVTLDLMCFFYSMTSPTSHFSGVWGERVRERAPSVRSPAYY